MGLLSNIVTGVGKVINTLKAGTILQTSQERAISTAGAAGNAVVNKAVGSAVVASAAAAGAAVALSAAGAGAGIAAAAQKAAAPVVTAFVKNPLKTTATAVATGGIVAGGGLSVIPVLYNTTKKATEAAVPVLTGQVSVNSGNVSDVAKVIGAGLGIGATAVGVGLFAEKILKNREADVIQQAGGFITGVGSGIPDTVSKTTLTGEGLPITSTPPITPETVSLDNTPVAPKTTGNGTGVKNYQKVNVLINQRIANKSHSVKYLKKHKHR